MDVIEIQTWEPDPNHPGCGRVCGSRTLQEVRVDVLQRLRSLSDPHRPDQSLHDQLDSLSLGGLTREDVPWPDTWRWIACYAVTGSNEGHYIQVDVIDRDGQRLLLYVGKTFAGLETALVISNALTEMLGA